MKTASRIVNAEGVEFRNFTVRSFQTGVKVQKTGGIDNFLVRNIAVLTIGDPTETNGNGDGYGIIIYGADASAPTDTARLEYVP